MAELQVDYRPTAQLLPYANNARTHSPEQVEQLAASMRAFGFTNPILIDADGGILAGHGRVLAADLLGLAEVPTITLGELSEAQRRAYIIADNQLALNAGWNRELLGLEIQALSTTELDLGLLGFADDELLGLLGMGPKAGLTD